MASNWGSKVHNQSAVVGIGHAQLLTTGEPVPYAKSSCLFMNGGLEQKILILRSLRLESQTCGFHTQDPK